MFTALEKCGGLEPSYGALNDFRKDNEEGFRSALIEGLAAMAHNLKIYTNKYWMPNLKAFVSAQ